jgi:hypothetical protein
MTKRIWTIAAAVVAVAVLSSGVAAATAAPASPGAQTIRLVGHFTDA